MSMHWMLWDKTKKTKQYKSKLDRVNEIFLLVINLHWSKC